VRTRKTQAFDLTAQKEYQNEHLQQKLKHKNQSHDQASRRGSLQEAIMSCDILAQSLIGLIEYSYHHGISSFSEAHLQRISWLSLFGPEQF
jgi:hypothetical protein